MITSRSAYRSRALHTLGFIQITHTITINSWITFKAFHDISNWFKVAAITLARLTIGRTRTVCCKIGEITLQTATHNSHIEKSRKTFIVVIGALVRGIWTTLAIRIRSTIAEMTRLRWRFTVAVISKAQLAGMILLQVAFIQSDRWQLTGTSTLDNSTCETEQISLATTRERNSVKFIAIGNKSVDNPLWWLDCSRLLLQHFDYEWTRQ